MSKLERLFYKTLAKIDDVSTEITYRVWKPFADRAGVEMKLTRSSEERIAFLAEVVRKLNETGGIKEIRAALGGDDGDLDEFAEALIRAGVLPPPGIEISRIRIKEVPVGPAPEEVRRAWLEMEMLAVKLPPSEEEKDFVTNEAAPQREAYAVLATAAVAALEEKSPEAAMWFKQNLPPDLAALTFGEEEVEIIATTPQQKE